jgi:hypothetical protein
MAAEPLTIETVFGDIPMFPRDRTKAEELINTANVGLTQQNRAGRIAGIKIKYNDFLRAMRNKDRNTGKSRRASISALNREYRADSQSNNPYGLSKRLSTMAEESAVRATAATKQDEPHYMFGGRRYKRTNKRRTRRHSKKRRMSRRRRHH